MGRHRIFKNFNNAPRYKQLRLSGEESIKYFGDALDNVMRLPRKPFADPTEQFYAEFLSSQNDSNTSPMDLSGDSGLDNIMST